MAREILQGPSDEGRASYQLAITTCDHCGQGFQQGAGELLPVEPEIVEMAECDAQEIGAVSRVRVGARASQTVPPAVRRRVLRRDGGRCVVPRVPARDLRRHPPPESTLAIEGSPSRGLVFRHADGTLYGSAPDAVRTDVAAKVFSALVGQGFSQNQSRNALARVSLNDTEARTCERVLRAALRYLTEKPGGAA